MKVSTLPLLFVCALSLAPTVHGIGCGEPFFSEISTAGSQCSDWQCSRALRGEGGSPGGETSSPSSPNNGTFYCVRGFDEGGPCGSDKDCYHSFACNTTSGFCYSVGSTVVEWQGYVAVGVAVFAFGSNFVPARKYETGNGLYFQFFMSIGIIFVGFGTQMVRQTFYFYPYAMIGGMLWCIGNTLAVPVIRMIGMGLSLTLWGTSNMIMGWASGRFGFWGLTRETVKIEWLSYVGIGVAAVAIAILAFVKPRPIKRNGVSDQANDSTNIGHDYSPNTDLTGYGDLGEDPFLSIDRDRKREFSEILGVTGTRILGVTLALCAGCFFGVNFDPPQLLMDQYSSRSISEDVKYSPNGLDYVFSHFFGIFCTAGTLILIFSAFDSYCKLPRVFGEIDYGQLIFPAFLSGVLWAVGQVSWFIANTNLGLVVSFPTVAIGPGLVASLWGVIVFKEIGGAKNLTILALGFVFIAISAACTVIAKQGI